VPRHSWPPHDFECPYPHNCPYLDWLSTTWVLSEYRRINKTRNEYLQIIDRFRDALDESNRRVRALERENAELKAKMTLLHQRQFKANRRKRADETEVCAKEADAPPRKRGAPVGHPGWSRPVPTRVDRTVHVEAPSTCPHCGSAGLLPAEGVHEHIQEDIVIRPRPLVTRYVHRRAHCRRCNRAVVQAGKDEIPNAPIGPVAKSAAVYLRYRIGITYRKTREILSELFGLSCVPASLVGFDRKAANKGEAIYEDLREKIRASDFLHADETSWRNDGLGHYVWYAGNEDLAYFQIDRGRSGDTARALFGNFAGVLVRDRYAAYNGIGRDWQSCLAHIIRRAREIRQEHSLLPDAEKDPLVAPFCDGVATLLARACVTEKQLRKGTLSWDKAAGIEVRFTKELGKLCKRTLGFKPAETLRNHLMGNDQKRLFTFLRNPGVPPTNNHAEQSLRSMVIFRKVSFGTRSEKGIKTHSIIPSLVQTARRQGVHPRKMLQTLLTADTATAQAALYLNSS